ncbi:MAG: hypothetical protein WAR38_02895 [Chitinophagaceae bacterium]
MKHFSILLLFFFSILLQSAGQSIKKYDIFSYSAPAGFVLKEQKQRLLYEKREGNSFCQIHIWAAQQGSSDPAANFKTDWEHFAVKPYNLTEPPTTQTEKQNGWEVVTGASQAAMDGIPFIVAVSTFTQNDISWCAVSIFNDEKYAAVIDKFILGINADSRKLVRKPNQATQQNSIPVSNNNTGGITNSTTSFDDGWTATVNNDYVKLTKAGTELRLHYTDKALDDARPNTIDAPEYYWSKYVEPYFNVSNVQKWSGVQYPVIYHIQANAVEKKTGKSCFVAIKIVYSGGARPVVVIAPDQNSYQQQFPHPNDIDPMLNANRFALTANDIIGTWKGSGGGGVEYYNVYSGTYAGMSAVSSTDEFTFNSNGTYSSTYRSASMNSGGAQFGGQDYKGNFSVTDWSLTVTNRYKAKTTTYKAQLIAVKGGFLLYMEDSDNSSMKYTLFKTK